MGRRRGYNKRSGLGSGPWSWIDGVSCYRTPVRHHSRRLAPCKARSIVSFSDLKQTCQSWHGACVVGAQHYRANNSLVKLSVLHASSSIAYGPTHRFTLFFSSSSFLEPYRSTIHPLWCIRIQQHMDVTKQTYQSRHCAWAIEALLYRTNDRLGKLFSLLGSCYSRQIPRPLNG
jgi:hypothetical protein